MNIVLAPIAIIFAMLVALAIPFLIGVVLYNVVRLVYLLVARTMGLVFGILGDAFQIVGHSLGLALGLPMVVLNLLFGRWSRLGESGNALQTEIMGILLASYRIAIVHPLRFMGLGRLVDKNAAPMPAMDASDLDREHRGVVFEADIGAGPSSGPASPSDFDGYELLGALPRGGSGARLYVAKPTGDKVRSLARQAGKPVERVVIKSFSLEDGSTMPQIVRESRALEAARDLGLVFEHELSGSRFHYVMPYVPGDDLATVTRDLHQRSGEEGLSAGSMRAALNYFGELLITLERFHQKGLWHKDIKPSNVIVSRGRVHLVDLGLVTPLRSAMTLTTHGTEYFRDPEMVRLAMQGVKVHEVDGVKFDLYSAGALLYSMLENSFPAHGSLSRFSRRVPEALQWVVRRAMADMDKRYPTATAMLADLDAVLRSDNPYGLKPGELPSMRGQDLAFQGWSVGAEQAAYRTHGFEDNLADRMRLVGERVQGAGDRVRGRMKHLSRKAERHAARRAKDMEERASRKRRPRGIGSFLATAAVVLVLMGVGSALFLGVSYRDMEAHPAPGYPTATVESYEVWDEDGNPVLVSHTGSVVTIHDGGLVPVPPPVEPTGPEIFWQPAETQPDALEPLAGKRRVLILNDLPSGFAAEGVEELLATLTAMELELVGTGSDIDDIEYVANAKTAVGVSGPQDPRAISSLEAFLLGATDLDGIVWLGRGDAEGEVLGQVIAIH